MKVLDLLCPLGHAFEGWFASEDDFRSQHARGLVQCPLCGSEEIRKGLSAPRLNLRASADAPREALPASSSADPASVPSPQALQAVWLQMARRIIAGTEDVGSRFAAEARRMHYGEVEERGIRGQASAQETAELLDEGIAVLPLLLPEAAKEPLQ
ncbi:DUF1178 family protein [Acidovorax sp. SDU_ACID1]|uniref:DUF1178 family protein n=1 Tax=Acidovorax sp. SDU_ACID1 TaxID=3136632 RepID=UPI00387325D0